jgi:hypothetical protein
MGDQQTFSIAVVKGASTGQVLRTERKRISVGASSENDIILKDPEISARHFVVLIDQGRWRIHTLSPEKSITLDRRWAHPETGLRGAVIEAAGAELLLFPGDLDQKIIDEEIARRASGDHQDAPDNRFVTRITMAPVEFPSDEIESAHDVAELSGDDTDQQEAVRMSMLPTLTGERPPDDIREAARLMLLEERRDSPAGALKGEPVIRQIREEKTIVDRTLHQETSALEDNEALGQRGASGSDATARLQRPPLLEARLTDGSTIEEPRPPEVEGTRRQRRPRGDSARTEQVIEPPVSLVPEVLAEP